MHQCLECVHKHLEQAMVIHEEEVPMGYPEHIRRVRGHLAEASRECVSGYPHLANLLRQWRRYLLEEPFKVIPNYDGILDYVEGLVALDKEGTSSHRVHEFTLLDKDTSPQIPDDLRPPDCQLEQHSWYPMTAPPQIEGTDLDLLGD